MNETPAYDLACEIADFADLLAGPDAAGATDGTASWRLRSVQGLIGSRRPISETDPGPVGAPTAQMGAMARHATISTSDALKNLLDLQGRRVHLTLLFRRRSNAGMSEYLLRFLSCLAYGRLGLLGLLSFFCHSTPH